MELTVRAATTAELPELMQLYTNARAFMQTYATIHRLASAGHVGGIGRLCVQWCLRQGLPVRADTHADNTYMQHTLEACGFVRCGTIYTEDGTPRWAYYHYAI